MKSKKLIKTLSFNLLILLSFWGCNENKIYNEYIEIDQAIWNQDTILNFKFTVLDDSSNYDLSYNVRYAKIYPFYNIYISYYLEDSIGNSISNELQEITLFDKKTGEPLGDGLGDLFDLNIPNIKKMSFPYSGAYSFKVKQFMRIKNLGGIMSFGLEIEKSTE